MNTRYDAGRKAFGLRQIDWAAGEISAVLVSPEYKFQPSHRTLDALEGIIGQAIALSGRSVTDDGYMVAAPLRFQKVLSDKRATAVVIFHAAGSRSTLIAYFDDIETFPIQPNGGDIDVEWPEGKLFRL